VGATKNAPNMDEDCLYLNVFTPSVDSGQAQKFPVMFYIHDGQFAHGSGNEFPGHQLAANGQVNPPPPKKKNNRKKNHENS
jgi:neuroligin